MSNHPFHALMLQAIEFASLSRWQTRPNPCVGALLVKEGKVLAKGRHKGPGLDHAEIDVLKAAEAQGINPAECSLVVTLEPCRHHGKTPPCTEAILRAGIRHVVIGAQDPNPEASGGAAVLRAAGVKVETGPALEACLDFVDDFFTWQTTDLPYTLLKLASTIDGRIASRTGHSKWISCPETRKRVHAMRRHMQAIIVGGNTFYLDNPLLTCRPESTEDACLEQPLAVVVTSRLPEAGLSMRLLQERPESTIFWTTVASAASPKAEGLRRKGVRVLGLPSHAKVSARGHGMRAELDLTEGLVYLRKELGCHYALCEGGGRLGLALLERQLANELHLHLAPKIMGDNEATPLFDGRAPVQIDESLHLRITDSQPSGDDIMITLKPCRQSFLDEEKVFFRG